MSKALRLLGIAGLLGGYAILAHLCNHPNTSQEYSDYFIRKATVYWRPVQTGDALEDGISLSKNGLPKFVRAVSGVGRQEPWGRWSEHSGGKNINIEYRQGYLGKVCLTLTAMPSPNQIGQSVQVILGDSKSGFTTNSRGLRSYSVNLDTKITATRLTMIPESPGPIEWDQAIKRTRIPGLALKKIILVNKRCNYANPAGGGNASHSAQSAI